MVEDHSSVDDVLQKKKNRKGEVFCEDSLLTKCNYMVKLISVPRSKIILCRSSETARIRKDALSLQLDETEKESLVNVWSYRVCGNI